MSDFISFIGLGIVLVVSGTFLITGVCIGYPRLRDAARIRLPRLSQFLLGSILIYFGAGAILTKFGLQIINGKILAGAIGFLIVISLVVEIKRIREAIKIRKNNKISSTSDKNRPM